MSIGKHLASRYDEDVGFPVTPIRRKPIARVMVFDLSTTSDIPIRSKDVNLLKTETQEWLRRLLFWAISNHYTVEIMHLYDYHKEINK